jgi:predicted kinase
LVSLKGLRYHANFLSNSEGANMSKVIFMVGAPLSGKSTWIKMRCSETDFDYAVMSRDTMVHIVGQSEDYDVAWRNADQKEVDRKLNQHFEYLTSKGTDFVIDMTNMSKKSRKKWIDRIDKTKYTLEAIVFRVPLETLLERNKQRPGKTIPEHVILNMFAAYEEPTTEEGFSEIVYV